MGADDSLNIADTLLPSAAMNPCLGFSLRPPKH